MGAIHSPAMGKWRFEGLWSTQHQGGHKELAEKPATVMEILPICSFSFFFFKQNSLTMEFLPPSSPKKKPSRPSQHASITHAAAVSAFPNTWKSP